MANPLNEFSCKHFELEYLIVYGVFLSVCMLNTAEKYNFNNIFPHLLNGSVFILFSIMTITVVPHIFSSFSLATI